MNEEPVTDAGWRQFLLGNVDDEERQRIEGLFVTDRLSRDRVLAAEQELLDDYLDDSLTADEKKRFLLHYGATPAQQRKLRIAKSIQEWALEESKVTETKAAAVSLWSRLRAGMGLKPVFVVPIALTSIIAIVAVLVWVNRKTELRNRHLAVEQELARLNDPASLREETPQMLSLELRPISVRSVAAEAELMTSAAIPVVELRLIWIRQEGYSTYRAVVRRHGDEESFAIPNLHAENQGGRLIRIRLPARILTRGRYQVELSGITPVGSPGPAEEYTFVVGG